MLDYFGQKFLNALFTKHPDWRRYITQRAEDETRLRIPSPHSKDADLYLTAEPGEVLVALGDWHTHVGPVFSDIMMAREMEKVLTLVEDILAGRRVATSLWEGGRVVSASLTEANKITKVSCAQFGRIVSWPGGGKAGSC